MNLTLRTLLAWLDDTLPPNEVHEIGKHVTDSPLANDIKERIQKVTRQRRLTVPGTTGPDAADPNLVASYLDNELDAERVVEYEKKCLTSDVHLAEVASVHQILSLIGQKAKVPIEARQRMYHLVKGRETVVSRGKRPSAAPREAPISEPVQAWTTPVAPRRFSYNRFGPFGLVVLLLGVLCWSAWKSLSPPPQGPADLALAPSHAPLNTGEKPVPVNPASKDQPAKSDAKIKAAAEATKPEAVAENTTAKAAEPVPPEGEEKPKANLPAGSAGQFAATTGILLRYNPDPTSAQGRQWERLAAKTPVKNRDRLLNLPPFRSTLDLGPAQVDMVGESEVWPITSNPTQGVRFNLAQGRAILHGAAPAVPVTVEFSGKTLVLPTPPAGAVVGLERRTERVPGSPKALPPSLRVFLPEGELVLKAGDQEETLTGPGSITYAFPGRWIDRSSDPAPAWVTETAPPPFDAQVGEQFLKTLQPDRPVTTELVGALDDESKEVRKLAINSLKALGDVSFVVPLLTRKDDAPTRRAAIAALRDYQAHGPEAAAPLHKELVNNFGPEQAENIEKLLVGFTPQEAKAEATYSNLVQQLASTDENLVGLRELAIDNLAALTGRDDLGYNPDKPEGKGLKAWKDLLRGGELHPPAAATKAKK